MNNKIFVFCVCGYYIDVEIHKVVLISILVLFASKINNQDINNVIVLFVLANIDDFLILYQLNG